MVFNGKMVFVTGTQSLWGVSLTLVERLLWNKGLSISFIFTFVWYVCVYAMCMICLKRRRESDPWTWRQWSVTWFGYWKPNLWSLGKQQELLTTEPSLHPQERFHSFLLLKLYKSLGNYCYVSIRWGPGRLRDSCTHKSGSLSFQNLNIVYI